MNDRAAIPDLLAEANKGISSKRIAVCNADTLNTPYKDGLTGNTASGTAYINMTSASSGTIFYIVSATYDGKSRAFLRSKTSGTWKNWASVATSQDIATTSVDAKQYFIAPPSVWARLQKTANVVSLSFSGTMEIALPDNADTPIATIPQPYRPSASAYGIFKVWPIRNASGETTVPDETLLLTINASGQLLAVNRFGRDVSLGSRYCAGNIIYIV